jgi:hypothetical protein
MIRKMKNKKCLRCDKNMLSQEGIDNICKGCSLLEETSKRICQKCNKNKALIGFAWCKNCYDERRNK